MVMSALVTPVQREPLASMNPSTSDVSALPVVQVDFVKVREILVFDLLYNIVIKTVNRSELPGKEKKSYLNT